MLAGLQQNVMEARRVVAASTPRMSTRIGFRENYWYRVLAAEGGAITLCPMKLSKSTTRDPCQRSRVVFY